MMDIDLVSSKIKRVPGPFTIVVDTREQLPWRFLNIPVGSKKKNAVYEISTVARGIESGDYTVDGLDVAIERKSKEDAFATFGGGRDRFERELERLSKLRLAVVIVEADWRECYFNPPARSKFHRNAFVNSVIAWGVRYPSISFQFVPGRRFAEIWAFRWFEKVQREFSDSSASIQQNFSEKK